MNRRATQLLAIVSLLSLSGCGPNKGTQIARCEQSGFRTYAHLTNDPQYDALLNRYMEACMRAHGYSMIAGKAGCDFITGAGIQGSNQECYERTDWWASIR